MPILRRPARSTNRAAARLPAADSEDIVQLRKWVRQSAYKTPSGAPVIFLVNRGVASSGMSRTIAPIIFTDAGPMHPGYRIAQVLGMLFDRAKEGIKIRGAGMDMGFALVDHLASKLGIPLKHEWL